MPRVYDRPPKYRLHKARNLAVVTVDGKNYYLGPYESPESYEQYARLIAEWRASRLVAAPPQGSRQPTTNLSINELILRYLRFAEAYYRKSGKPTAQLGRIKSSVRPLRSLYGNTLAAGFGPLALKNVRQAMMDKGWSRGFINTCVGCIVRMFKWGASEQLVSGSVFVDLSMVTSLRKGRCPGVLETNSPA